MKTQFIFYVIFLFVLIACKQVKQEKTEEKKESIEELDDGPSLRNLLSNLGEDTLKLFHRKSECGEWGGSSYVIGVYKEKNQLMCYYKYYEANCEILEATPEIPIPVKRELTTPLTKEIESLAISFVKELLNKQFQESSGFHAENLFAVKIGEQINLFSNGGTNKMHDLADKLIEELQITE